MIGRHDSTLVCQLFQDLKVYSSNLHDDLTNFEKIDGDLWDSKYMYMC